MDRRHFIQSAALGIAANTISPTIAMARNKEQGHEAKLGAGGLFYTKDAPGRWSEKVAGHLPSIEVVPAAEGVRVKVLTGHEMRGYQHYIVKHMLLNEHFEFIAEKLFDPMKDLVPMSEFSLGNYSGRVNVVSMCNKHDVWLNHIDI